jgi:hypothetical protein
MHPLKKHISSVIVPLIATLVLSLNVAFCQTADTGSVNKHPVLVNTLNGVFSDFEIDNLGNLFLVGEQQQLIKRSPSLDSLAVYNDKRHFGKLYSIDVSNPLKVLLFFRDFGTIIILDRFLNVRTVLNLRTTAGILQASAITQSFDNNIWVYDELDNMVKKVDENGRVLTSSPDFRVIFDNPPIPQSLCDFNRFLYAYDSTAGLLVMDYFGAYRNKIAFTGWQNVHGLAKGIAATDANGLVYYEPGTLDTKTLPLPKEILGNKKIRVEGQKLYALSATGTLRVYRLP